MRTCVSCKVKKHPREMFRFSSDHAGLFLLTAPPKSGRSGWLCRSASCIRFLLNNPGCSYRALKKKIRNSGGLKEQLKSFIFQELSKKLIDLYRSGRIIAGKIKIEKDINRILFIVTSRQEQQRHFQELFSNLMIK